MVIIAKASVKEIIRALSILKVLKLLQAIRENIGNLCTTVVKM